MEKIPPSILNTIYNHKEKKHPSPSSASLHTIAKCMCVLLIMVVVQTTLTQDYFKLKIQTTTAGESFSIRTRGDVKHIYTELNICTITPRSNFLSINFNDTSYNVRSNVIEHWGINTLSSKLQHHVKSASETLVNNARGVFGRTA